MFVGLEDELAVSSDTRWETSQMKSVVFYKEYDNIDHGSFNLGNQSNQVLDDLVQLVKKYNK